MILVTHFNYYVTADIFIKIEPKYNIAGKNSINF